MALFSEQKVVSGGNYKQISLSELAIGESCTFFIESFKNGTSEEFGPFTSAKGLQLDIESKNEASFIESAELATFILNTMLSNMRDEGKLEINSLYRIEKAWDRGQKLSGGRKAKGYGYEVFKLSASPSLIDKLASQYKELLNSDGEEADDGDEDLPWEGDKVPTPKRPKL